MNRLNTVMNKNVIYLLTARYHERKNNNLYSEYEKVMFISSFG